MKDHIIVDREKRENHWVERKDCFQVQIFQDREQSPDPAGLCDGGDYVCRFQLRINDDDSVYCSWQDTEYDKLNHIEFKTYQEFYRKITSLLETLK